MTDTNILTFPLDALTLQSPSKIVDPFDHELEPIVQVLLQTVEGIGIGLAAPQLGYNIQVVVMDIGSGMQTFINPRILSTSKEKVLSHEQCLSIPYRTFVLTRFKEIDIEYQNLGSSDFHHLHLQEFPAIVAQHELDHLAGILILQKGSSLYTQQNEENIAI